MYKIIPPLQPEMQGKDIANLHEVLQFLVKNKVLQFNEQFSRRYNEHLEIEIESKLFGEVTAQLVYLFREQHDLLQRSREVDNHAIDQVVADTINELLEELGALEQKKPEEPVVEESSRPLKPGIQNEAVKQLQEQLQKLGFTLADVSGYFGRSTRQAVEQFQQQNDLEATGIATEATLSSITETLKLREEKPKPKKRIILAKELLFSLEKQAEVSPLDLKLSDPETFSQVQAIAATELGNYLKDYFKESPEIIREAIGHLDLYTLVDQQKDIQGELLHLADELPNNRISREEAAEVKMHIEALDTAAIPQNPLDTDAPLKNHPMFQKFVQQAKLYRLGNVIKLWDYQIKALIQKSPALHALDDEAMHSLVKENILTKPEAKKFGLAANLYQLFDENESLTQEILSTNVGAIKDLAAFEKKDWQSFIDEVDLLPPHQLSREDYASLLAKRIEKLYPSETLQVHLRVTDENQLREELSNPVKLINRYPGLKLVEVMVKDITAEEKIEQIQHRIGLLDSFYEQNQAVELLALDYMPDSKDLEKLNLDFTEPEKEMIFAHMKARQRVYSLTWDAEDTKILMENGYSSAACITQDDFNKFKERTGMDDKKAAKYYETAKNPIVTFTNSTSAVNKALKGGFLSIMVSPNKDMYILPDISACLKDPMQRIGDALSDLLSKL